jgi:hypothetical protein
LSDVTDLAIGVKLPCEETRVADCIWLGNGFVSRLADRRPWANV